MRGFSLGGSLVLRQALFLILIIVFGLIAIVNAEEIRALARSLAGADPAAAKLATAALLTACGRMVDTLYVGVALACLLILGVSMPMMHKTVAQPIHRLASSISDLAEGRVDGPIEGVERKDEIGSIARALRVLRDAVMRTNDLVAEIKKRDDREALLLHQARIHSKVEQFGGDLSGTTARLSATAQLMCKASEAMTEAARRAAEDSSRAKSSSSHTAADISCVALASEQLLDSIEEINHQVLQSTDVVKKAVAEAQASSAGMNRLSGAAARVGDVVKLISSIAAQTNLLALNATIEAARAGESGRSFAIVAQEVKTLATQTGQATQKISEQISEIQSATNVSVAAIEAIQNKIAEVEKISAIIAAAVHEQGAATQEIARTVRSAAEGANSMSSHVENVEAAMRETSSSLDSVVTLAHKVDEIAEALRSSVGEFTDGLQAA